MGTASDDAAERGGDAGGQPDYLRTSEANRRREAAKDQARAVGNYLQHLKDKAGMRNITEKTLARRESTLDSKMSNPDNSALDDLLLMQDKKDVERDRRSLAELEEAEKRVESKFVQHAAGFAERKGIEFETWLEFGVSRSVLRKAGIKTQRKA